MPFVNSFPSFDVYMYSILARPVDNKPTSDKPNLGLKSGCVYILAGDFYVPNRLTPKMACWPEMYFLSCLLSNKVCHWLQLDIFGGF